MNTVKLKVSDAVQAVIEKANEHAAKRIDLAPALQHQFVACVLINALARLVLTEAAAEAAVLAEANVRTTKLLAQLKAAHLVLRARDLIGEFIDANVATMAAQASLLHATTEGGVQ